LKGDPEGFWSLFKPKELERGENILGAAGVVSGVAIIMNYREKKREFLLGRP
jgi:hypothetical protein